MNMSTQIDLFAAVVPISPSPTIASRSTFYHGDCLVEMDKIADKSIDAIICDLPFGTTACKWDSVIPFEPLWAQYERVIKDNGAIVLFGTEPFSSQLRISKINLYKYDWIWKKNKPTGFTNAHYRPLYINELISVFSLCGAAYGAKSPMVYLPQNLVKINKIRLNSSSQGGVHIQAATKKSLKGEYTQEWENYPVNILEYPNTDKNKVHPTQKPVALMEYLIKTYTNEGDTVLDNCMGSGTTGVAAKQTGRHFIGIEQDEKYFNLAVNRVSAATNPCIYELD